MAKHKKHDRTNGAFGEALVTPADELPEELRGLAVPAGAKAPEPEPVGDLVLEVTTSSDDIGRRVERLSPEKVDALAPRIRLLNATKPFPRDKIEGVVKYTQGYLVLTEVRPYYVKGA